jgi:hypothetical protein
MLSDILTTPYMAQPRAFSINADQNTPRAATDRATRRVVFGAAGALRRSAPQTGRPPDPPTTAPTAMEWAERVGFELCQRL